MQVHELTTERRETVGKSHARKTRARGMSPGIVYGKAHAPVSVAFSPHELVVASKSRYGRNTVMKLRLSDSDHLFAMVQDVQIHPLSRQVVHADFIQVQEDVNVLVNVPLHLVGKPEGVKMGGILKQNLRAVQLQCVPGKIPVEVQIDVSHLNIGDVLHLRDVAAPEGTELLVKINVPIAHVEK